MTQPWPPSISTFAQLEDYINLPTTIALSTALFEVDFHPPDTVIQVRDGTVYTNDDRTPWRPFFFGQVKQAVCFQGGHRTFFLHGGEGAPASVAKLFHDQLRVLQAPVIHDDDNDLDCHIAPAVDRCTDGERFTGKYARNLEVHTAHCGGSNATVWTGTPPHCTASTPDSAAATEITAGDWVLCEGTLHNRWSPAFDDPRQYELLASRIYILPIEERPDECSSSGTLSATAELDQPAPEKRGRSVSPASPGTGVGPAPERKRSRTGRDETGVPEAKTIAT
ncbi:hypothetical protein B0H15DRAFT_803452 [Mycena belliarum]|uniref:Uncharacterized protein n=1 Tax=Mycena belliarum TaxID=1033014 RepID=A0AAD6TZT2_9AGAR|nr:hypothetical protein B0H15DRAFT_803452 [Mycena belliae]